MLKEVVIFWVFPKHSGSLLVDDPVGAGANLKIDAM